MDAWKVAVEDDRRQGALLRDEDVRSGAADIGEVEAEPGGEVRLGIHVDGEHLQAALGERSSEIDDRGRLSDATLLVGDRNDLPHVTPSAGAGGVPPVRLAHPTPLSLFVAASVRCLRTRTAHGRSVCAAACPLRLSGRVGVWENLRDRRSDRRCNN